MKPKKSIYNLEFKRFFKKKRYFLTSLLLLFLPGIMFLVPLSPLDAGVKETEGFAVLLLAGSILAHIFGFPALYDEKQLKYLCCFHRYGKVFFQLLPARMAIVTLFVLLLVPVTQLAALISGKDIFHSHYFILAALAILVSNLSLVTGAAFGAFKNRAVGISLLIAVSIALFVFIPRAVIDIGNLRQYVLIGLLLQFVYFIAMGVTAYILGSRKVYPLKQEFPAEEDMFILITRSETNVLLTGDPLVKAKVYNHLSGKEKLKSQVDLVSGDQFESAWNSDFAYLPHPDTLEEIGPRALHTYLFGKAPEVKMDTWEVMFKFALQHKLIVMDDFLKGIPPDKIKDILLKIEEKELFCLIISSDYYFTTAIVKDRKNIYCLKTDPLFRLFED